MRAPSASALAATVAVLVVAAAMSAAVPTAVADTGSSVSFDPGVPDEYAFEATDSEGVATVDGERYESLQAALDAARPGDTVELAGRFDPDGPVTIRTANVTVRGVGDAYPVVDGTGEGDVLRVNASGVTVERVWVRNAGFAAEYNDAAIWVAGDDVTIRDARITETTFGIWLDGVADATVRHTTIVGRESVRPLAKRGNGIQVWNVDGATLEDNRITDVRDGIYYSWASHVTARNNTMWEMRYGVHYMYSDHCTLANNTSVGNDVGYTLMVSEHLRIVDNVAVGNAGQSGHGIMVKSIDHTAIRGNHLVDNEKGLFVYNSLDNTVTHNLVAGNGVGVHLSAGSVRERVHHNTFVRNDVPVLADVGQQVAWNASDAGNYWGGARTNDVDDDGVSETRHRPAGMVQHIVQDNPNASVFARSPALEVVRLAESTLPVVESPGVVDHHPLTEPPHDWRRYYE